MKSTICSGARAWFILAMVVLFPALICSQNIRRSYQPDYIDPSLMELRVMPQPAVSSKSIVIFETGTGTILFQKNADEVIPPASLTKLVVMALALSYLQKNNIPLDTQVTIHPESWAENMPVRSSLMFLGPRQTCSWEDLLLGLAVDSGNDAAVAIGEAVDGDLTTFVAHMNSLCASLGMKSTHFVEPSGYDEHNVSTARDFSYFVWNYVRLFPQAIEKYHSVHEFTYPHGDGVKGIRQFNRNKLLFAYPGADGLKTGYIDESGYNLAFTAKRENMRLAGVILGGVSEKLRFNDARDLLNYGFEQYQVVSIPYVAPEPIRIWNGSQPLLAIPAGSLKAVLPIKLSQGLETTIDQYHEVEGPFSSSTILAWVSVATPDHKKIIKAPLEAGIQVDQVNFAVRWAEKAYLAVRNLTGRPWPTRVGGQKVN